MGDNSNYQKKVLFLLSFQWIFFSFLLMGMPFLFAPPEFLCIDSLEPLHYSNCNEISACKKSNYIISESSSTNTITQEFELYCDSQFWIGICQSLFFVGFLHIFSYYFYCIIRKRNRRNSFSFDFK